MGALDNEAMEFQGIIMAGGTGSRMMEVTSGVSKCLLPVGNIPLFMHPLRTLKQAGICEVIIIVAEADKSAVQDIVANDQDVKVEIVTIPKNEEWGTADSLKHIKDRIKRDIVIISCDLVTDFSLQPMANLHRIHDSSLTILLTPWPEDLKGAAIPGRKGKHKLEKDIIGMDDKARLMLVNSEADFDEGVPIRLSVLQDHPVIKVHSNFMDSHVYMMKKEVVDFLIENKNISTIKGEMLPNLVFSQYGRKKWTPCCNSGSADILKKLDNVERILNDENYLKKVSLEMSSWNDHWGTLDESYHGDHLRCYAYVNKEGFTVRANTLVGYMEANKQTSKYLKTLPPTPSATQYLKSQVGDSIVGKDCELGEKASMKKSVVGARCKVKEKVKIVSSVVMENVLIEAGSSIHGCIISNNVIIGANCDLKNCIVGPDQKVADSSKLNSEVLQSAYQLMEV